MYIQGTLNGYKYVLHLLHDLRRKCNIPKKQIEVYSSQRSISRVLPMTRICFPFQVLSHFDNAKKTSHFSQDDNGDGDGTAVTECHRKHIIAGAG